METNPTSSAIGEVKMEDDRFDGAAAALPLEVEMKYLMRERDLLKREVSVSERMQKYTELEKSIVEEKLQSSERRREGLEEDLRRSERRCEELEAKVQKLMLKKLKFKEKLNRSRLKYEGLRQKEVKSEEKELRNVDTTTALVLNVNHVTNKSVAAAGEVEKTLNVPELDQSGKRKVNVGDGDALSLDVCGNSDNPGGNRGIGLSTKVISDCHDPVKKHFCSKGDRELVHGGTQEDGTKVEFTHPGSKPSYISDVAKSPGSVQDNDGKRVRGGRNLAITGTENDGADVDAYHDLNQAEGKGTTFRINRLCNLFKIIKDIKMNLEKENLEKFEHSCFGNLLKTNELTFQGQLIVQLLLHMDLSASNKERLVFKINNSAVEFGPCDFFHITGLRVGNLETATRSLTTSSTIHQSVFRGTPAITLKEIEEAFLNASTSHEGKGEVTLKLALLYFVYGTLLAKTSNCKIELKYFHLIEDLQKFNAFPWGQLAYEYLVSSILEARFRMDANPKATLIMQGFCDALQAWTYEMMPSVAAHCASRVNNIENLTPRILRWSATKAFRSKDLKKFFAPADLKNTKGKKKETVPEEEAKQKKRRFLCEDRDQMLRIQPSSAATPSQPSMIALTHPLHQCTQVGRTFYQNE